MHDTPLVTAVIPTHGRPDLVKRAVYSALNQTYPGIEVVVVVDGPDDCTCKELATISDPRLRVIELPTRSGGCGARNRGVESAQGKWIAFLDDDDEWFPEKTELQMKVAMTSAFRYPIVSSKLVVRTTNYELVWPRKLPRAPLSEYLLARNDWSYGEGLLSTITLLFPKDLYELVPFKSSLARHQDFDWVLRAVQTEGAGIEFLPQALAIWHMAEQRSSISTTPSWRSSFEWIESVRSMITERAYASFVATSVAPQAARQGDWGAFYFLLRTIIARGNPTAHDIAVFMAMWFTPRRLRRQIRVRGR
jgi:glycosyltransferase involved in cell wall biosynthesis